MYVRGVLLLPFLTCALAAQEPPPRLEVNALVWRTSLRGTFQSGIIPVDLRSDLAMRSNWQFHGSALIRIAGRHRLVVEGSPLTFSGENLLARSITYGGRTYQIRETVGSSADLTTAFVGYQFDALSRTRGHLGLRAGAEYLDAAGLLVSRSSGVSASDGYRVGIPLAGLEGRIRIVPGWFDAGGEIQGMALGGYGHYVQGSASVGVGPGRVQLRAGYRWLDADVGENTSAANRIGVAARIGGPVLGITVRLP
jgi:hypothetical protein